jgi:FKBP-type peptidyl-prolyl cis-trans isomerase FklB
VLSVDRVIPAWTEVLQMMKPGDTWMIYVPAVLGYGDEGAGDGKIPGGAALIFKIELISVER